MSHLEFPDGHYLAGQEFIYFFPGFGHRPGDQKLPLTLGDDQAGVDQLLQVMGDRWRPDLEIVSNSGNNTTFIGSEALLLTPGNTQVYFQPIGM